MKTPHGQFRSILASGPAIFAALLLLMPQARAGQNEKSPPPPQPSRKNADDMNALLKTWLDLAKKGFQEASVALTEIKRPGNGINIPLAKPHEVYAWSLRWREAQRAMSDKKEDNIAALDEHLKRMKDIDARVKECTPAIFRKVDCTATAYWVVEAEIWLTNARAQSGSRSALLKASFDLAKRGFDEDLRLLTEIERPYQGPAYYTKKPGAVYTWSVRWMNAERELNGKEADPIAALQGHLIRMKKLEKTVKQMGPELVHAADASAAAFWVAEAEVWIAKEKAKVGAQ